MAIKQVSLLPENLSAYDSDLLRLVSQQHYASEASIPTPSMAGELQQTHPPHSYIPTHAHLNHTWQDVMLPPLGLQQPVPFSADDVSQLENRLPTNTSMRAVAGYNLSFETDQSSQIMQWSE
jgi:hypothetical protein